MRRFAMYLGLCALILAGSLLRAQAQINIAADVNSGEMLMDVSLRDADINEVLSALFNTTNGKYQLQLGGGVVGQKIQRLQLTRTPFEQALNAIIGSDYSYQKRAIGNGSYLYTITGRTGYVPSPATPRTSPTLMPTMAPPSATVPATTTTTASSGMPMLSFPTKGTGSTGTTGSKTTGGASSSESSVVKLIAVSNLDLEALADALGGTTIALYAQQSYGSGSDTGYGTGYNSNTNNGYNNNGYNNGYTNRSSRYNNNNTGYTSDPYNTTNTRTTRTSSRNTNYTY